MCPHLNRIFCTFVQRLCLYYIATAILVVSNVLELSALFCFRYCLLHFEAIVDCHLCTGTVLSFALYHCHLLHIIVICYSLSFVSYHCHLLYIIVICSISLSFAPYHCHLLHIIVICYISLSFAP